MSAMPEDVNEMDIPERTNVVLNGIKIYRNNEPEVYMFHFKDNENGDQYYVG